METQACALCGAVDWCGRLCLRDPGKRNGLLFWPDGREKTLRERGLGFFDVPVMAAAVRKRPSKVLRSVVGATETPVTETRTKVTETVTETPNVTKTDRGVSVTPRGGRPRKDDALSAAERKRRQRERLRVARAAMEGK